MITIHNLSRGVRGVRVAWTCEEMGLAYRAVPLEYPVPAEYRARYPLGSTPFLEDDAGVGIGESVAQMLYLAQRYGPTPLLPPAPAAMARVLQITVASEASLMINPQLGTKFAAPEDQKANWTRDFCQAQAAGMLGYLESLMEGDHFVGGGLTLADIAVATALGMWDGALGLDVPPKLAAHRSRMQVRPAYQKAAAAFATS